MKTGKRNLVVALALVGMVAISAAILTQVVFPVRYSFDEAAIITDVNDSPDMIQREYESARSGLAPDLQLLSEDDFDFSNPEEFATVLVFFDLTSHSVFPIRNVDFFVLDLGGGEGRFLYRADHTATVYAGPGDTEMIRLYLAMNVKGLSDEEVAALVTKVKVEIQYEQTLFGGRHQRIKIPANLEFAEHRYF